MAGKTYNKILFINTSDSFAVPIGGERVTWGVLTVDNDQLELFKTGWLRILGAQAHVHQFNLRRTPFIAISIGA